MSRMPGRGWRPLLRMAARDALRARGRSALTLAMIMLPVLGVTAAAVVDATMRVDGAEAPERRMGAADAAVTFVGRDVQQAPDPDEGSMWSGRPPSPDRADLATVGTILGRAVTGIERHEGSARVGTDAGSTDVMVEEVDLRSPLAEGLHTVVEGRAPESTGEVVVTSALAARGPGVGERLQVQRQTRQGTEETSLEVVGVVRHGSLRTGLVAIALPGALGLRGGTPSGDASPTAWLVDTGGPVTWEEVRALNAAGAVVLSRAVLHDPPPSSQVPRDVRPWGGGMDQATLAVLVLIVVMALIEVVLLAGPAFAVGARRQQRTLALLAATGGTPAQARRVILASAVVLGAAAAVGGVLLGMAVGWLAVPVVQRFSGEWLGPFDVPWLPVLGVAVFGLVSAVLAAVVPAFLAARQDVVAVLAGRRGDRAPTLRSPIVGLVLFGAGVAGAVTGTRVVGMGEFWIAASAVLCVLGMVLLVPVVLAGVALLARFLPLSLRYAVRDAARHRTRTVPAVAAVAATVAGVVALGIGAASDEEENRRTYAPMLPMGEAVVDAYDLGPAQRDAVWRDLGAAVARHADGAEPVVGIASEPGPESYVELVTRTAAGHDILGSWMSTYGASTLVDDRMPDLALPGLSDEERAAADRVLRRGGAVVFGDGVYADRRVVSATGVDRVRLRLVTHRPRRSERSAPVEAAGIVLTPRGSAPAQAVIAPELARALGARPVQTALRLPGPVDAATEQDLEEAIGAVRRDVGVYVERGYRSDDEYVIVLLVLAGLGTVLMLGGTLTATFLALSDARPDLATLSAVGSAPRTRRAVAAAYALVVGGVGALLGAAVGLVPGIAVTWPLTASSGAWVGEGSGSVSGDMPSTGPFLDIPWLLVGGLVVLLPLLTALVVALFSRSRLPMVARLA